MSPEKRKRTLRLTLLYGLCIMLAIFSLSMNIKTVPLNKKINVLNKEYSQLLEENEQLLLSYLRATRLDHVEKIAREQLNMAPPRRIRYVPVEEKHY